MTAEDFNDWLARTGLSAAQAAEALGVSKSSVLKYRQEGGPPIVALACSAIFQKLKPWAIGRNPI